MTRKEDTKIWEVRYSDGYTKHFENPFRPMGNATRHLNSEKSKGRDHGAVQSIMCLAPESMHVPMKSKQNGTREASVTLMEKVENILENASDEVLTRAVDEMLGDESLDDELYELIIQSVVDIEKSDKLLHKLMEFTEEKDSDIYDDLFLRNFVERIRRSLYVVDDDLKKIEENLSQE